MAPELLYKSSYDYKVDVWALGILYYTMVTGIPVFDADNLRVLYAKVKKGDWIWPSDVTFSLQGLQFLKQTFQYDEKKRATWDEIKNHVYL